MTPGFVVSPVSPVPDFGGLQTGKSWNATFLETWSLPAWEFFELPLRGGALQFLMELVGGRPLILMSFGVKEVFPEAGPSEGGRLEVRGGSLGQAQEGVWGAPRGPPRGKPPSRWAHLSPWRGGGERSSEPPTLHLLVNHRSPHGVIPLKPRIPAASPRVFFLWLRWYLQ